MPGAYAHITLVNMFRESARLDGISGFPTEAKRAIRKYFKFLELGSVSPDYSYLALTKRKNAKMWADLMHGYSRKGNMIHAGIRHLKTMKGSSREKALAWFLGYTAHVTMDVVVHPVVELKVGKYIGNEQKHQECEMHQDAHIFQILNLEGIGLSNYFESCIKRCSDPDDPKQLDKDIAALWHAMLRDEYPDEYAVNEPNLGSWHKGFQFLIGKIASEGYHLIPIARHVGMDMIGMFYPNKEEVDSQFIRSLVTPQTPNDYDTIFNKAIEIVAGIWQIVAAAIVGSDTAYLAKIGIWDLDSGTDDQGKLVFWGQA